MKLSSFFTYYVTFNYTFTIVNVAFLTIFTIASLTLFIKLRWKLDYLSIASIIIYLFGFCSKFFYNITFIVKTAVWILCLVLDELDSHIDKEIDLISLETEDVVNFVFMILLAIFVFKM